jgi:chromosome partitioning protein
MTVISIANQKGGVGKTATAINLSSAIAERGRRVLLIDLDPQGNATISLGFNRREVFISIYEVLIESMSARSAIFPTIVENLFILPANENMPGAEVELIDLPCRAHILKNAIDEVKHSYDYIFIDCPPSLGILTLNALTASDSLLVTMQAEFLALEGLTQLLKTVNIVREQLNPDLGIIGVLFTMYDSRTRLTREVEDEVRRFFEGGTTVFNTVIPRTVRLAEAPSHGLPITLYAPSSNGAEAYRDLASEVIDATETRAGKGIESPYPGTGRDSNGDSAGRTEPWNLGQGDPCIEDIPESPPAA